MKPFKQIKYKFSSIVFLILALTGVCFAVPIVLDAISACKAAAEAAYTERLQELDATYANEINSCMAIYYEAIRNLYEIPYPCDLKMEDEELSNCLLLQRPTEGLTRKQFDRIYGIRAVCTRTAWDSLNSARDAALAKKIEADKKCDELSVTAPIVEN